MTKKNLLNNQLKENLSFKELVQNIAAGFTVSFVALTLGAAFGVLSNRGAFAGMMSASIIAIITSLLGGTKIQCSGPTGPMTTVTAVIVAMAHDKILMQFPNLPVNHFINITILLSGILLIIMAILRLGKFVSYIPNVVISGFMNGIAIIIWLEQIKKLLGLGGKVALTGPMQINITITVISAILVFVLPTYLKKYLPQWLQVLSATFLTIVIMTILCYLLKLPIETVELSATLNSWQDFVNLIKSEWPTNWSFDLIKFALLPALQLSMLAYLDTLMTSLVIDKITKTTTKQNQELLAQGVANSAVALIGGIPGAQATIRSVLIVKEKATMRLAGILVGIFALLEIILFQNIIALIPQAVFIGILIKVGWDVFDIMPIKIYLKSWIKNANSMWYNFLSNHDDEKIFVSNWEFMMIFGTTIVTIFFDLNIAVAIFTVIFYLCNKILFKNNPMRDLRPVSETEGISQEM